MIRLVAIGGTGDAYLVCALYGAFRVHHGRTDVVVVLKRRHACIAQMFGVPFVADDAMVARAESDPEMQRTYDNALLSDAAPFYVHPSFLRSGFRLDQLTTRPDVSQADMYRMILQMPLDAPLALPRIPAREVVPNTVVVIPEATSWPNTQPRFWTALTAALRAGGRFVAVNDTRWSLQELLDRCARAEWVIGPQCGVMSMLVTGRWPCRKTLASPMLTADNKMMRFLQPSTFPYAYVTKFGGEDHDVQEFEVADGNHAGIIEAIVCGVNARRLWPHDPAPVMSVSVPLTPGDFLDRLAVLTVKWRRFPPDGRAAIDREYRRYVELRRTLRMPPAVDQMFTRLLDLHGDTFDQLERLVPAAVGGANGVGVVDHVSAIRANRERVELKWKIDAACRAPYAEAKSYYGSARYGAGHRAHVAPPPPVPIPDFATEALPSGEASVPILVQSLGRTNFVSYRDRVYVVPQSLGPVNLEVEGQRLRPEIRSFGSLAEAQFAAGG